jgi:hypothetical protein
MVQKLWYIKNLFSTSEKPSSVKKTQKRPIAGKIGGRPIPGPIPIFSSSLALAVHCSLGPVD